MFTNLTDFVDLARCQNQSLYKVSGKLTNIIATQITQYAWTEHKFGMQVFINIPHNLCDFEANDYLVLKFDFKSV